MSKNAVLITGTGGAIGEGLCRYFLKNTDYNLVLSYTSIDKVPCHIKNYDSRCRIVIGDISDRSVLEDMFVDIVAVIHLASNVNPQAYSGAFSDAYKYGANTTIAMLDFIKNWDEPIHIIFPSSGGTVYSSGNNIPNKETDVCHGVSPYGIQKIMFENYLNLLCRTNTHISCNVLRISNPYGLHLNNQRKQGFIDIAIHKILNNEQIEIWSPLNTIRDYIHIDDLCIAFHKALQYRDGFSTFNIGSGEETSINELLTIFGQIWNRIIDFKLSETNCFYPSYSVLDISKAREILNWVPGIDLRTGIENIIYKQIMDKSTNEQS